ncbi:hypothetical protein PHLCEN_2v4193 [Hermanssonia centrifuga]|uniref:DUF6535 domain-containing protein n=1 Tax=Hermanssonia centrifuga TaxID=98765 RepID=A0A2R6PYY9_9APHY|nr:hypothetical protein PHLCEN_2v4193 [Hermanssonia centrifuga]
MFARNGREFLDPKDHLSCTDSWNVKKEVVFAVSALPFIETRAFTEAGLTTTRSVLDLAPSTLSLVPTVQWQNRTLPRSVALIGHGGTLAHSSQASPEAAQETGWTGVEKYIGESDASEMKVLNDDIDALLMFASPEASQETGWFGVERYMREYDERRMSVLNDEINALPTFAGLFSGVLTAFVVPSYMLLQPDNNQLTVQLLSKISSQLVHFEILPPFINSTVSDTSTSPVFQVSTSARWMNCLWFLSLIFSLSSALFGMLAKQWVSEYMQWRKIAEAPRENVRSRHLRNEAWEEWRVSAGISAIPALLELAVVLFLAGLVILVWTLDDVVAIVITTAVSVVILVLCAVTVLPAVYRRCPYKSPTAWVCVVIFDSLAVVVSWTRWHFRWLAKCVHIFRNAPWFAMFVFHLDTVATKVHQWIIEPAGHLATTCSSRIRRVLSDGSASPPSFPRFSNWRERDLYIDDLGSSEISDFNCVEYPDPENMRDVAKDVCEVMPLVRALSWVRKGTEDPRLLKHVATSAESLHMDRVDAFSRYYVFMYVLRKLCSAKSESRELQLLSDLGDHLQSKAYKTVGDGHQMFRGGIYSGYDYLDLQVNLLDRSDLWVLGFLLLGDIMYMLDDSSNRLPLFACLSQHMFSVFRYNQDFDMGRTRLQKIYNDAIDSQSTSHQKLRSSGVHTMILEVLCSVSRVHMAEGTKRISADGPRVPGIYIDNEVRLAVQMFNQNTRYSDPFARHQFVMMADLVMRSLDACYVCDKNLMGTLLEKMSEAVTISLKEGYENCGCYHTLPWISSMVSISDCDMKAFLPSWPLWLLLDVLEKTIPASDDEDLEEGDGTDEEMAGRKTFIKLKKRVEQFHPRPSSLSIWIAMESESDPVTSVEEDMEPLERMPSDNPAPVLAAKNETEGIGDGKTQHGGNEDILVPESDFQAARPSEGISVHTVGYPAEETQEICASSLHHDHQDLTRIQHMELDVPIDRQDAVPSHEQDPDITAEGDSNDDARSFTEPWTVQSNSFEVAASDDSRRTALMLPINPSASDGLPSTRPLPHDSTAHTDTPLAFSDGVPDPGDHGNLPDPTLQPSESTSDLGRIISRSSSTSRDEDVQPVEQSSNSTEPLEEGPDSIEMAQRDGGTSQAR